MNLLQAIILGLTQGLTEFIPVSSSGHLILVGHLLGISGSLFNFDVALDIGTLAALILFFWQDFLELAVALFVKSEKTRLAWLLALATIPGVAAGVLLQKLVETKFQSDSLVAVNLIVVAVVMLMADQLGRKHDDLSKMTASKSVIIGLAQALALVPGVSRSGITISAGLFEGFDRVSATKFSFWLSAPIIAGATAKVLLKHSTLVDMHSHVGLYLAGILAAAVSGYLAIKFLISYLGRHGLAVFAYYRLAVGALILGLGLLH